MRQTNFSYFAEENSYTSLPNPEIQEVQDKIAAAEGCVEQVAVENERIATEMQAHEAKILATYDEIAHAAVMISNAQKILDNARVTRAIDDERIETLLNQHNLLFRQRLSEKENLKLLRARFAELI